MLSSRVWDIVSEWPTVKVTWRSSVICSDEWLSVYGRDRPVTQRDTGFTDQFSACELPYQHTTRHAELEKHDLSSNTALRATRNTAMFRDVIVL